MSLPERARVVVIGGGVIGTSVAYHLAHARLDRRRPAGARPADLGHHLARGRADGHLRLAPRRPRPRCAVHPRPVRAGSRPRPACRPGSSRSASSRSPPTPDRLEEYRRVAAFNRLLRRRRARDLARRGRGAVPAGPHRRRAGRLLRRRGRPGQPGRRDHVAGQGRPAARRDDRRGRAGAPACSPRHGARDRRAHPATGDIEAEYVVNCAGMWARQLGDAGRREHPAAGGRALLPDHRADRGRPRRTCRCSRTRPPTGTSARRAAA